jgi:hypothetical protein
MGDVFRWQKLKRREKRTWLLLALLDLAILTIATLIDSDYFLVYVAVIVVGHAIDVAFLLAS